MLRTRSRARDRGRSARALLCAGLSLAAALALAAPLVHAHLAAADARGLCGEHHPESGKADPGGDVCSLCIAGAHAPAMREPGTPRLTGSLASSGFAVVAREIARDLPRHRPGTPRAPPHSV